MTPAEAQGAISVAGAIAGFGLFLPTIEKAWDMSPSDPEAIYRVRTGEAIYLGTAAALSLLACKAYSSPYPFVVGFGLALLIVGVQEHALRHRSLDAGA